QTKGNSRRKKEASRREKIIKGWTGGKGERGRGGNAAERKSRRRTFRWEVRNSRLFVEG
ncbi:hypothetical protein IscW_ISCW000515, partial [Ixodes scapularis]